MRLAFVLCEVMTTHNDNSTGEINALLGKGTEFDGKLTFDGRVRIDGKFSGEIFTSDVLILGENAEVRANIDVGTLVVRGGTIWGNVRATQLVEAHAPGKIFGNIQSPQISIDKGVIFEGQCMMAQDDTKDREDARAQDKREELDALEAARHEALQNARRPDNILLSQGGDDSPWGDGGIVKV